MIKIYKVNKEHPDLLDQLNKEKSCGTVLVYSDHCPHCMSMKPQWEQMKQKLHNKPANIYEINGEDLPYINHPIKNVVDGFPMILNVNNRNIVPFNEERTLDNFVKFAESNILNMKSKQFLSKRKPNNNTNKNRLKVKMIKKVTFQNNDNKMNMNENNAHKIKIGNSLNLDRYVTKKLPFLNIKKKNTTKKSKRPKKNKKSGQRKNGRTGKTDKNRGKVTKNKTKNTRKKQ